MQASAASHHRAQADWTGLLQWQHELLTMALHCDTHDFESDGWGSSGLCKTLVLPARTDTALVVGELIQHGHRLSFVTVDERDLFGRLSELPRSLLLSQMTVEAKSEELFAAQREQCAALPLSLPA